MNRKLEDFIYNIENGYIKSINEKTLPFEDLFIEYKSICKSNGITISMSRKGTPIDDSPMESWHGILKKETLHNNNITSLQEYQKLVEEWILFYNTTRLKLKK